MATLRVDLTGRIFGYLKVVALAGRRNGKAQWRCLCACGAETVADGYNLSSGHTTSCGCWRKVAPPGVVVHGKSKDRVHRIWRGMLKRCNNPNEKSYPYYGGRGIRVCDRWQQFVNFYADMGDPPDGLSIDRIDNNGDYEPGNCRWATKIDQARNKRSNHMITRGCVTRTLADWLEITGLHRGTVEQRIRHGWPESRLLDPLVPKVIMHRGVDGRIKGDA